MVSFLKGDLFMKTTLLAFLYMLIFSISVFANPYPATLDNGNLVIFVTAYNMKFFDNTMKYSPLLKSYSRVIDDSLYRALGI